MEQVLTYLQYFGLCLWYTLGAVALCGLAAHLSRRAFVSLAGNGIFVYITSLLGTPVHELGHAIPCPLFGHKITEMKLLLPPRHPSGTLGYVEHSYNRKNPWAILGNLFIGVGPIFSGLGVMILMLYLCFPAQWGAYLETSSLLAAGEFSFGEIFGGVLSLLFSLWDGFSQDWFRSLLGLIVILSVSQHITLSGADIKGALSAMPLYLAIVAIFAGITMGVSANGAVLGALWTFNLRILSLFSISIAFSLMWMALGLLIYLLRRARTWF